MIDIYWDWLGLLGVWRIAMNNAQIERGLEELNKIANKRIESGFMTQGAVENHMRLKLSDLRAVLLAMKDVHNKPCNNCGYIGCNQCEPAKETTVSAVPDDPLSRRITYFTIGGITYVPQTEQQRSLSVEEIVHIILLYTDKEKGHGMTDVAKTAIALHKRIYKE